MLLYVALVVEAMEADACAFISALVLNPDIHVQAVVLKL